jgi:glycosyltransferase involved in cell wall biosynthesis
MATVSVILITLNEERNIDRCLRSVHWADEIVVVDSFSRDRTVERARQYTDRIYQHEYPGSSRQVERGIGYATGEWILILDADEEVSPELAGEIRASISAAGPNVAYRILRRPWAFGRWIDHGGWFPDYQLRLFRKDRYHPEHQEVHGGFGADGPVGQLGGLVYHYTYETIYGYVARMNDYTSLEVSNKMASSPGRKARARDLLLSPLSHFVRMFIVKRGYRDGVHGFVLALLEATYAMLLYAKLWEYQSAQSEGRSLPPINNDALNQVKRVS